MHLSCICARVHKHGMTRDRIQGRFGSNVLREELYALFLNSPLNGTTVAPCGGVCHGVSSFAEHPDDVGAVLSEVRGTEGKDQRLAGTLGSESHNLVRHLFVALVAV